MIVSSSKLDSNSSINSSFATFDILSWFSLLCNHIKVDHSLVLSKNVQALYNAHEETKDMHEEETIKCAWFIKVKKEQKNRIIKHLEQKQHRRAKKLVDIDIFSWSSFLYEHVKVDHSYALSKNVQVLYNWHKETSCAWYIRVKKELRDRMIKQREQKNHRRKKELAKKQIKIKKKERIVKKHVESYNCKRCSKNCFVKFISNFKLHQHIRERHAKKFKSIETFKSIVSTIASTFAITISHTSLFFEFVAKQTSFTFVETFEQSSQSASITFFSSSKMSWAIITTSFKTSTKFSRLFKSIKTFFTFSSTSSISFQSSMRKHIKSKKLYFIVKDFYAMFHEKSLKKSMKINIQINVFFSSSSSFRRASITIYFKFVNSSIKLSSSIVKSFNVMCSSKCKKWSFSIQVISSTSTSQSTRALLNQRATTSKIFAKSSHVEKVHFERDLYSFYFSLYEKTIHLYSREVFYSFFSLYFERAHYEC